MKKLNVTIAVLAMFALIFTSCSKDEVNPDLNSGKATLSFGAIVNDLVANRAASKQSMADLPTCSNDTPAYVSIVLSRDGVNVVGTENDPFTVHLASGQLFTVEAPELELEADNYTLEHFAVYNDEDDVIWVAPRTGSALGSFVDNTLPLNIDLRAGVKKYVEVDVLCFDNRDVNEYGYQFFELDAQVALQFCFFANYCPPNGMHYTANYNVSIWAGTDNSGTPLYTNVTNTTGQHDNGDFYASPLCFALPDNDDVNEEYLYYEVTLLDWAGNYGNVDNTTNRVITGTLTKQDILDNFVGDDRVNYEHLRFGCEGAGDGDDGGNPGDGNDGDNGDGDGDDNGDGDGDDNGDGDGDDNGDGDDGNNDDCETAYMFGNVELNSLQYPGNNWGWGLMFDADGSWDDAYLVSNNTYEFPLWAAAGQNDTSRGRQDGVVRVELDGTNVHVQIVLESGVSISESHIYFGEEGWPASRAPGQLGNNYDASTSLDVHTYSYSGDGSFYLIVHSVTCD